MNVGFIWLIFQEEDKTGGTMVEDVFNVVLTKPVDFLACEIVDCVWVFVFLVTR